MAPFKGGAGTPFLCMIAFMAMMGLVDAKEIVVNVTTLGGFLYEPSSLVKDLHDVPRPNYKAITETGQEYTVKDNDFEPKENNYWHAILAAAAVIAAPAAFLMLVYYIFLCARCCCPEKCTSCSKQKTVQRAALFILWGLAFAVVFLCYFPRQKFHSAVSEVDSQIDTTVENFNKVHKSTKHIKEQAAKMQETFAKAGCSANTENNLKGAIDTFATTSSTHEDFVTKLNENLNNLKKNVMDNAQTAIDVYLGCLASLVCICILFAICAICNKNYVLLDVSAAMGNITLIIFFVAICAQFMTSLMLSDYCVNPDKSSFYLIEQYMDLSVYKYASFYLTCGTYSGYMSNAFEADLNASTVFLDSINAASNSLKAECTNKATITSFLASTAAVDASVKPLIDQVGCTSLYPAYVTTVRNICGGGEKGDNLVDGLVWLYIILGVCSAVLYIVFWQTACMRNTVVKQHEKRKKKDEVGDHSEEESQHMLQNTSQPKETV
jgi:ABC-type multidrug transport system fused ATPase/permease subunit